MLETVHFLDMWVEKKAGSLCTTLYKKDTDRNTLLMANSYHPITLKQGLPQSQFFRRICHTTEDFMDKSLEIKLRFLERGYPIECVEEAHQMSLEKTKNEILKKDYYREKETFNHVQYNLHP